MRNPLHNPVLLLIALCLILLLMQGCARIIVQVGTSNEVDGAVVLKPKTGVGVAVDKADKLEVE